MPQDTRGDEDLPRFCLSESGRWLFDTRRMEAGDTRVFDTKLKKWVVPKGLPATAFLDARPLTESEAMRILSGERR